jgi:hypothetical protein
MDPEIQQIIIAVLSIETVNTKDTIDKAMIAQQISEWGARRHRAKYLTNGSSSGTYKRVG